MYKPTKTTLKTKEASEKEKVWFLLDAKGKILGRFAAEIAKILMGKHKPSYTATVDTGDGVIIINADQIEVTGSKEARKIYRHYTGFMGGLKEIPYRELKAKRPERILERAISGMMPKSRLGKQQLKKLRIFAGEKHGMEAQKPIVVNL
ncbi:MAG: 50S ribosomal protein L13 [Parachlamydiales bacterium]|jgi:large subunit ribosomal protein L13